MKKDLIISSLSKNYLWSELKCWINSIKKTTYSGDILFFCYNFDGTEDTLQKLKDHNIEVVLPNNTYLGEGCDKFVFNSGHITKDNSHIAIHNVRFFHIWQYLNECNIDYDRIINTDIRDIVFQYNPSDWLDKNLKKNILAPCEEVLYKNQNWNITNSFKSFGPYVYEYILKESFVCNAGSFAAKKEQFKNLCIINYLMSNNTGINADQAGLNVLFNVLKNDTQLARMNDGWAFQAGGVNDSKDYYQIKNDVIYTKESNVPYCILHQYDRVPELKTLINKKYD